LDAAQSEAQSAEQEERVRLQEAVPSEQEASPAAVQKPAAESAPHPEQGCLQEVQLSEESPVLAGKQEQEASLESLRGHLKQEQGRQQPELSRGHSKQGPP
jgi:hypothetical protein